MNTMEQSWRRKTLGVYLGKKQRPDPCHSWRVQVEGSGFLAFLIAIARQAFTYQASCQDSELPKRRSARSHPHEQGSQCTCDTSF